MLISTAGMMDFQRKQRGCGGRGKQNGDLYRRNKEALPQSEKIRRQRKTKWKTLPPQSKIPLEKKQQRRAEKRKVAYSPPERPDYRKIRGITAGKNRKQPLLPAGPETRLTKVCCPASHSVPCWRPGCRGRAPQYLHVKNHLAEWSSCVQQICDNGESVRSVQFPVIGTMYLRRRTRQSRGPWNTAAERSTTIILGLLKCALQGYAAKAS